MAPQTFRPIGTPLTEVDARFKLSFVVDSNIVEFDEAELPKRMDEISPIVRGLDTLDGAIVLSAPGLPPFEIVDEMTPLVYGFCLGPASSLLGPPEQTLVHVYRFFTCGSMCVLVASRGLVTILSDDDQEDLPTLRCELNPLLIALCQCGIRYAEFLAQFGDDGPHAHASARLRDAGVVASERLEQIGRSR